MNNFINPPRLLALFYFVKCALYSSFFDRRLVSLESQPRLCRHINYKAKEKGHHHQHVSYR